MRWVFSCVRLLYSKKLCVIGNSRAMFTKMETEKTLQQINFSPKLTVRTIAEMERYQLSYFFHVLIKRQKLSVIGVERCRMCPTTRQLFPKYYTKVLRMNS